MKRRTLLRLVGVGAVAEGLAIACGGATTPPATAAPTVAATAAPTKAPGTGKLTLLGALVGDINDGFAKAYETEHGAKTAAVRLSAGEGLAKLRADKANPQFSVWLGGAADGFIAAAKEGLLEPYVPAGAEKLAAGYKDKGGMWTVRKAGIELQESPWKFSSIYPQNQSLPTFCLCFHLNLRSEERRVGKECRSR